MHAYTALAIAAVLALSAVPASAGPHWNNHFHHGFFGGPGLAFGLAGVALATGLAAEASCVRFVPVYDDYGVYIGRRRVNVC